MTPRHAYTHEELVSHDGYEESYGTSSQSEGPIFSPGAPPDDSLPERLAMVDRQLTRLSPLADVSHSVPGDLANGH